MKTKELALKLTKLTAQQLLMYKMLRKSKITYAVLFIFLSPFGVHWIYVKKWLWSIPMIVATFLGGICGIFYPPLCVLPVLQLIISLCSISHDISKLNDYNSAIADSMLSKE